VLLGCSQAGQQAWAVAGYTCRLGTASRVSSSRDRMQGSRAVLRQSRQGLHPQLPPRQSRHLTVRPCTRRHARMQLALLLQPSSLASRTAAQLLPPHLLPPHLLQQAAPQLIR
jgi:hypothetical protein